MRWQKGTAALPPSTAVPSPVFASTDFPILSHSLPERFVGGARKCEAQTVSVIEPVLIANAWSTSRDEGDFQAWNPTENRILEHRFPISRWEDCEAVLGAAERAAADLATIEDEARARFLEASADALEARIDEIVAAAELETGLPATPRLRDIEMPRTTGQLRQAARAARDPSWRLPTIDSANNIRSYLAPLGPIAVFGPNNFPFAFNGIAGGDFATAIAAGNPVIAKANPGHPRTTQLMAEEIHRAAEATGMPSGTVQLLYRTSHENGARLIADPRVGGLAYTGSRRAGLALKAAADAVGKPAYFELSSVNPVVLLPGALAERGEEIAAAFTTSCLMGSGQFCTNPGLVFVVAGEPTEAFLQNVARRFDAAPAGTLLTPQVAETLAESIDALTRAGANRLTTDLAADSGRVCYPNTLLSVSGKQFLDAPLTFQAEAFGNASLVVVAQDVAQLRECLPPIEGSLTGCLFTAEGGEDDEDYAVLAPLLRQRVGRLLNDKMPTGVAVSPAMNHGGPFPSTGHPHFTAVGIPAALRRFTMLQCFDNVRPHRLPPILRDANPLPACTRSIDGAWTTDDVAAPRPS